eukprot:SAG11_NODE_1923_length_4060_cov_4.514012_5_plen_70_part_00
MPRYCFPTLSGCGLVIFHAFAALRSQWEKELETMVKTKQKAEIQALSSFGFQYLTKDYLPQKLAAGDWI